MKKTTLDSPAVQPRHWNTKRNLLIDAAVIILVALIIGAVWWAGHRPKPEPVSAFPQYSQADLVKEVNKKYGAHDYIGAINLINGQKIVNETSTQLLLAGAYANAGDNKRALAIYEQLDKSTKLNDIDTATAAAIAERDKQYQKAIDFYKKAKERLKGSANDSVDQAAIYDYQISALEKKL
jgi:tetratricopeptide (TPR) repeat protein